MNYHVSLAGKSILNLYIGKAEDAKADKGNLLNPTNDKITYSDGLTETVFGFDIPVTKLNKEFDLSLLGKKDKWYDHKVSITDITEKEELQNGEYKVKILLAGGSGKAKINSALLKVLDNQSTLTIEWHSPNYDYIIVDDIKYLNQSIGKNSTFSFPIKNMNKAFKVIGNTTAMGVSHQIEYKMGISY